MLLWRLVKHRMAMKAELETPGVWTLDDALRANAILDAEIIEDHAAAERTRKAK